MKKIWKILGIGLVILAFIGAASAHWQQTELSQIGADEAAKNAEELLDSVQVEEFQSYRYDTVHYRLVSDSEYVGVLWGDVNLDDLTVGEPYSARWGTKAPLIYNGETVSQIFLDGTPGAQGWHNTDDRAANGQARVQGPYGHCGGAGPHNLGHANHGGFRYR